MCLAQSHTALWVATLERGSDSQELVNKQWLTFSVWPQKQS